MLNVCQGSFFFTKGGTVVCHGLLIGANAPSIKAYLLVVSLYLICGCVFVLVEAGGDTCFLPSERFHLGISKACVLCQHRLVKPVEVSFLTGKASSFRAVVGVVSAQPRIEFYICLTRYRRQLVALSGIAQAELFV